MATKKNDELAMVETEEMAIVSMEDITASNGNVINTLNLATFEGKINTLNAINNAQSLTDAHDTTIDVCDCITMPGVRKGRGNTPDTECQNTYLLDTKGNAWFTQSDGIARSVKMIAMLFPDFGKNTPDGCLHVHVEENTLKNGNSIKSLVVES